MSFLWLVCIEYKKYIFKIILPHLKRHRPPLIYRWVKSQPRLDLFLSPAEIPVEKLGMVGRICHTYSLLIPEMVMVIFGKSQLSKLVEVGVSATQCVGELGVLKRPLFLRYRTRRGTDITVMLIRSGANSLWMAYARTNVLVPAANLDWTRDSLNPILYRIAAMSIPLWRGTHIAEGAI